MFKYILPLLLISSPLVAKTCNVYVMDLETQKTVLEVRTKASFKVNPNEIIWNLGDNPKQVCDITTRVKEFAGDAVKDCYYDKSNNSFTVVRDNTLVNVSECEK